MQISAPGLEGATLMLLTQAASNIQVFFVVERGTYCT